MKKVIYAKIKKKEMKNVFYIIIKYIKKSELMILIPMF